MSAKYIVFSCDNKETAVVVPDFIQHDEVGLSPESGLCSVVSGGRCHVDGHGRVHVEGFSKSLGVSCRPQDAQLIQKMLQLI